MTCEPWPYDTTCLPAGWPAAPADMDAGQRSAYDTAWQVLAGLAVRSFGVCTHIARPCSACCAVGAGYSLQSLGVWYSPYLFGGRVFNGCGCASAASCGCGDARASIVLDGPVAAVVEVLVDGATVAPELYRVDNGTVLVRTDGGVWPLRQDLNAPATAPGTFQVTYQQGTPLPAGGRRALTALMVELHKASCGDSSCKLPARVTNIVREGVTYSLLDDPAKLLDAGRTGIAEVDAWLNVVNPHGTRTRMAVYSPDVPRRRVLS